MPVVEGEESDWRKFVKENIGKGSDIKELKDYAIIFGELYRCLPGGILTRCIGTTEACVKLQEFVLASATQGLLRARNEETSSRSSSQLPQVFNNTLHRRNIHHLIRRRLEGSILAFFIDETLPTNSKHARKLKKTVKRYFIDGSTLYHKWFNGEPLKCLGESVAQQVMQEIHVGECDERQGMKRLHWQLLNVRYYWPTMKNNAYNFVKKCHTCQVHANLSHKPPSYYRTCALPGDTWGLDLI
ncbi:unnamed protein product [Prunus armeniaca]